MSEWSGKCGLLGKRKSVSNGESKDAEGFAESLTFFAIANDKPALCFGS
jgi:hypothetical protein